MDNTNDPEIDPKKPTASSEAEPENTTPDEGDRQGNPEAKQEEKNSKKSSERRLDPDDPIAPPRVPELDRTIFHLATNPVEELVKDFVTYPENQFEKTGFYAAIDPETLPLEDAKKRLRELIAEQKEEVGRQVKKVSKHLIKQRKAIEITLVDLEKQVQEQAHKLMGFMTDVDDLKVKKAELLGETREIKAEIRSILENIGVQRENIIERRILALRNELEAIISVYEEISNSKNAINAKEFNNNKDIYAKRAVRYQKLFDQANERLEIVHGKLKKIPGMTDLSHQFLFWAGVGAAGGAGWFFSVYVVKKTMFSNDFLSYFFSQLFSIGTGFAPLTGVSLGLALLACLIGILVMTTILSYLGQILLLRNLGFQDEKKSTGKNDKKQDASPGIESDLSLTFGDEEKNFYRTRITAGSFFTFWIQALPVVFLLGVLFILLSVSGTGASGVANLMSSLSGQFIGTSIAFGAAGLLYIYIRTIIDRRMEQRLVNEDGDPQSLLMRNWELLTVLAVFLFAMASMVIWPNQEFVAVIGFIAIVLMTGFVVAYAVYYRGLLTDNEKLKNEMVHISFAIDNCHRPRPLYIMGAEGQQFKYNYLLLMEQMYKLSQIRNMQATELLVGKEMASRINLSGRMPKREHQSFRLIKRIQRLFSKLHNNEEAEDADGLDLSGPENSYYQEYSLKHRDLKLDLKTNKEALVRLEAQIQETRTEKTRVQVTNQSELNLLKVHKASLQEASERLGRLRIFAINRLKQEQDKRVIALQDGFDLGLWHRTNDVEPAPKYEFTASPKA